MLGNYRSARHLAVGVTVASMAGLLAGCATGSTGSTGSAVSAVAGPQAGNRAQAETFARDLLTRFAVPASSRSVRLSPVPLLLRDPWAGPAGSSAPGSVDLGELDAVPLAVPATEAFLVTHEPGGADMTGTGQENSQGGVHEVYLHLGSRSLPRGINDAEAVMFMVPRGTTATLISIYVHVIWFPSRTAAEHLDAAEFGAVTVSAVLLNPKLHHLRRTFRSTADIVALAGLLLVSGLGLIGVLIFLSGLAVANVFPVIFAAALRHAPGQENEVSGLLIMGVSGGAILLPVMGVIDDAGGPVPALAFLLLAWGYLALLGRHIMKANS